MIRASYLILAGVLMPSVVSDCPVAGQLGSHQQATYYYSGGERVAVRIATDRVAIRLRADAPADALRSIMQRVDHLRVTEPQQLEEFPDQRIYIAPLTTPLARTELEATLAELNREPSVEFTGLVVIIEEGGASMVMTDRIVARFKETVPADTLEALYRQHDLEVVQISDTRPGRTVLRMRATSSRNALEVANAIFETGLAEYAQPDFYVKTERRSR